MKNFLLTALCVLCVTAVNLSAAVTIPWGDVDKTGATLSDLPTRNWSDLQSKPTTAAGLGLVSGSNLDAWAAKTLPTGPVVGTTDTQTLTNKDLSSATNVLRAATTSATGAVQLADQATGLAGTDAAKVPPVATVQSMIGNATSARATAPALYFDGVTAGARAATALGAAGDVSTSPFTMGVWVYNDGVAKTVVRGLRAIGPSATTGATGGALALAVNASDALTLTLYGATASDYRRLTVPGFSTTNPPGWTLVTVTWDRASAPVLSIAGLAQTPAETTAGTPPAWTDAITATYDLLGIRDATELWSGRLRPVPLLNAALTPAETLTLARTGQLPDRFLARNTASRVAAGTVGAPGAADGTTLYSASGSAGNVPSSAAVAGARPGGAGAYVWQLTSSGAGTGASGWSSWSVLARTPYVYDLWARRVSGTVTQLYMDHASTGYSDILYLPISGSWQHYTGICYASPSYNYFYLGFGPNASSGDVIQIDDFSLRPLGQIARAGIQPGGVNGGVIHDLGDNHLDGVYTGGVTPVTDATRGSITGTLTWAGTHEAKALLADQALLPPNARIDSITVTASAATSGSGATLNDGDTTSWWAAATALTANTKTDITPAHRFPASSGAADLKIQVDPDTANYTGSITATINYSLAN